MGNLCQGPTTTDDDGFPKADPNFVDVATVETLIPFYKSGQRQFSNNNNNNNNNDQSSFTVMTYNILADGYEDRHYEDCSPNYLTWDYRWKRILSQIIAYDADIVCMQEPTRKSYDNSINDDLSLRGYYGIHAKRVKNSDIDQSDGLFIKKDKFDIISHKMIRFQDILKSYQKEHQSHLSQVSHSESNLAFSNTSISSDSERKDIDPIAYTTLFNDNSDNNNNNNDAKNNNNNADQSQSGLSVGNNASNGLKSGNYKNKLFKTSFWNDLKARKDVFIIALLKDKITNNLLFAVTSHLYWNPKAPEIKSLQGYLLSYAVDLESRGMLNKYKAENPDNNDNDNNNNGICDDNNIPIVLCMDANALAYKNSNDIFDPWIDESKGDSFESGVYTVFTTGELSKEHVEHPSKRHNMRKEWVMEITDKKGVEAEKLQKKYSKALGYINNVKYDIEKETYGLNEINYDWKVSRKWKSAYREASKDNKEPKYTTKASWFEGCIDYVFISNGLEVIDVLQFDKEEKIIPNKDDPSDHLPLVAKIRIK